MDPTDTDASARYAAEVLTVYLSRNSVAASDLPALVRDLRMAFGGDGLGQPAGQPASASGDRISPAGVPSDQSAPLPLTVEPSAGSPLPAVAIADSVKDEYLVSLEDGKHYRSLKRHLMAKYGMTPDDYRAKWCLPAEYPMVAPSYARQRSEVAKRIGLGHSPLPKGSGLRRA